MSATRVLGPLPDGRDVEVLRLGHAPGPVLEVLTLGAGAHRLEVTCGDGVRRNVVLGLPDVPARLACTDYVGGTIGRYANRIAGGRFELDGRLVEVSAHDRGNALHGGPDGFDVRLWDVVAHGDDEVVLRLVSPDGDQGYPGEVTATVGYRVSADAVHVSMEATTDAPTVVNLTNHAYFRLADAGTIEDHLLEVAADDYTPVDATGLPVGAHAPVDGTPFDLRRARPLGAVLAEQELDHDFVVRGSGLRRAATLTSPATATALEVWSDQPGLQVYAAGGFDGTWHARHAGIALEPQHFPDSPHHPEWPSTVLRPGETYRAAIEWRLAGG